MRRARTVGKRRKVRHASWYAYREGRQVSIVWLRLTKCVGGPQCGRMLADIVDAQHCGTVLNGQDAGDDRGQHAALGERLAGQFAEEALSRCTYDERTAQRAEFCHASEHFAVVL